MGNCCAKMPVDIMDNELNSCPTPTDNYHAAKLYRAAELLVEFNRRCALLIEDNAAHALVIRRTLSAHHWDVRHFTRASAAIEAFNLNPHSIILLDLSLPDGHGLNLLTRLKAINDKTCAVVVTSANEVRTSVDAMRLGAVDYVVKADVEETKQQIIAALERAWLNRVKKAEAELVEESHLLETTRAKHSEAIALLATNAYREISPPLINIEKLARALRKQDITSGDDVAQQELIGTLLEAIEQTKAAVEKLRFP